MSLIRIVASISAFCLLLSGCTVLGYGIGGYADGSRTYVRGCPRERIALECHKGERVMVYLAGEVLDIDAITGGFNFQAAWTTFWYVVHSF